MPWVAIKQGTFPVNHREDGSYDSLSCMVVYTDNVSQKIPEVIERVDRLSVAAFKARVASRLAELASADGGVEKFPDGEIDLTPSPPDPPSDDEKAKFAWHAEAMKLQRMTILSVDHADRVAQQALVDSTFKPEFVA